MSSQTWTNNIIKIIFEQNLLTAKIYPHISLRLYNQLPARKEVFWYFSNTTVLG